LLTGEEILAPVLAAEKYDQTVLLARWELKRAKPGSGHESSHENNHATGGAHERLARSGHSPEISFNQERAQSSTDHQKARAESHDQKSPHGYGNFSGQNFVTIFSASSSLPAHDPSDNSGSPHAKHTSAHHLFEAFVFLDKNWAPKNPQTAAAISRALIRGARFVGENLEKAAELSIQNGNLKNSKESWFLILKDICGCPG
jgi:hypothetical protein